MNEIISIAYSYARAVWRRRWWAIAAAWLLAVPAWIVVLKMPDQYEASARVFVDSRTPLRPVLEGIAIQEDYESELARVREALLSRPQLEAVARQTNLDVNVSGPAAMAALIDGLQQQIKVTSFAAGNQLGPSRDTVYMISYQHNNRDKSIEVVRTLLSNFMEGTLSGNRAGSSETQSFLNGQIADLEKRLQDAEERLAEFKKRNIGMIPGEGGDYFARLGQAMTGLQASETSLAVAVSRRAELQRQLASASRFLPGTGTGGHAAGTTPDITLRRQEAEQQLETLLLRFTDRHPEVVALRKSIDDLRQREAAELAELQSGGMGTGAIRSLSANPVYQQIQAQLSQVQVEIASHRGAADQHRREIATLRRHVDQAPEIDQEFARLNRDYDVTKEQYEQLVARREQARVADDAARTGIVRFDEIEPPHAALEPVAPKRQLLILAVLVFAFGAGIAVAALPQLLAPTFDDTGALERKFGLPVLGSITVVRAAGQQAYLRREIPRVLAACAGLFAVAGLLVVTSKTAARLVGGLFA